MSISSSETPFSIASLNHFGTRPGAFTVGIGVLGGFAVAAVVLMLTQVGQSNAVFLHRDENFVDELSANGFGFVLQTLHFFVDFLQANGIFKWHVVNLIHKNVFERNLFLSLTS